MPVSRSFEVREARQDDAASLASFLSRLIAERLPVIYRRDRGPSVEEARELIDQLLSSTRSALFVAEVEGAVVGMLDFQCELRPQRSHAGSFGMSVDRQWRRKGVGRKLLESLLAWARPNDIRRLELEVLSNNYGAVALYRSAGFVVEGIKIKAVEVDGEYVDLIQMVRLL